MGENKKVNSKIWIVPNNDLEARTIIELLEKNGEEYFVTGQGWGASWENLEPEIKEKIEEAKKAGKEIYGVELIGNIEGTTNIDHHKYSVIYDTGVPDIDVETGEQKKDWNGNLLFIDDRTNNQASIEQVAEILEVELSLDEKFVAANDKGYIPAMEKLGAELGISEEDLKEIIANIRMRDRQMQGITLEQEAQAQEAVERLGEVREKSDYILVDKLPHSKASTVTDRLYGKYDNLLITSTDGETNFFGSTEIIKMLNEKFPGGWSGGQLEQGSGFWGGYADQEAIKQTVQTMVEKAREQSKEQEKIKQFWIKKYSEDKIGTVAKLSQAMQHMAWLREWKRIHGDSPRIKPITKKVNGEKVKTGEADIAVPWSQLHEFFRQGNEYGDVETVKFLSERIESGDISDLTLEELHDLSERENVKWSDGIHSLNPFQGYLYDFIKKENCILEPALLEDYGKFYPISDYIQRAKEKTAETYYQDDNNDVRNMDYEHDDYDNFEMEEYEEIDEISIDEKEARIMQAKEAFNRYYTTRLLQKLLAERKDSKYYNFVNFDITSVTTPEQIKDLDKTLIEIIQSPEIEEQLELLEGDAEFERKFLEELREEIEIEIKKDSDRIENAHKVFVALETGDLDELLSDPETAEWAKEVYEEETRTKSEEISE